jgi:sulfite exporter TauE/SafE
MLGSITWLGESGRNARWWVTVTWFGVGAVGAGALVGWLMGWFGAALSGAAGPREAAAALALLAVAGIAADLRLGGLRLPTVRRQVDDRWLNRYRGWVYGVGFGFQLGLGVVTVVTTSAVYLALAAAVLSGSPAAGAMIGAVFGAVRWLSVLPGGRVRRSADLVRMDGHLRRWEPAGRRVTLGGQIAAAVMLAMVVVA